MNHPIYRYINTKPLFLLPRSSQPFTTLQNKAKEQKKSGRVHTSAAVCRAVDEVLSVKPNAWKVCINS